MHAVSGECTLLLLSVSFLGKHYKSSRKQHQQSHQEQQEICLPPTTECRSLRCVQHMAISIDEELTIHNHLLDDLDEDVTVTHSRMRAAQKRVAAILRDSGGCRFSCAAFGAAVVLVVSLLPPLPPLQPRFPYVGSFISSDTVVINVNTHLPVWNLLASCTYPSCLKHSAAA